MKKLILIIMSILFSASVMHAARTGMVSRDPELQSMFRSLDAMREAEDKRGLSPLQVCLDLKYRELERDLIEAVRDGDVHKVTTLLAAGADPNVEVEVVDTSNGDQFTYSLLLLALDKKFENLEVATLLAHCDRTKLNYQGYGGMTALHSAVVRGCLPLVQLLLNNGADPTKEMDGHFKKPVDLIMLPEKLLEKQATSAQSTFLDMKRLLQYAEAERKSRQSRAIKKQ